MATAWTMKHGCATCEFWGGQRQAQRDPRVVEWFGSGVAQVKAIAIVADKYLEVPIREKSAGYVGDA